MAEDPFRIVRTMIVRARIHASDGSFHLEFLQAAPVSTMGMLVITIRNTTMVSTVVIPIIMVVIIFSFFF